MLTIGITGQNGFVGKHLYNSIGLLPESYKLIDFQKDFFEKQEQLDAFVSQCDVIVHLAAMNRHSDQQVIYNTNIQLVENLIASLERTNSKAHIIMSSSSQEEKVKIAARTVKIEIFLILEVV